MYNADMEKKTEQMIQAVEEVLKQFEPIFQEHGGGAELVAVEADEIVLRLLGNCAGCGLADLHFGAGIETMIKEKIPSIKKISYSY